VGNQTLIGVQKVGTGLTTQIRTRLGPTTTLIVLLQTIPLSCGQRGPRFLRTGSHAHSPTYVLILLENKDAHVVPLFAFV
jgi:hypothetical protein